MDFVKIKPLDVEFLEGIDYSWHTDEHDNSPYFYDKMVKVTPIEAETYYEAANELYDMFVEAGEYVIENDLLHEINIPFNLTEIVKESWDNDVHWHLYGRFDFAGGIDAKPIKLLEFNADTPTVLVDTAIIQWAALKANNMEEDAQFNNIYEAIRENFQRLVTLEESVDSFDEHYEGWKILFSSIRDVKEDEDTTKFLMSIAQEAGFQCEYAYIDEIEFNDDEGVFYNGENYEYFFKLIPWEDIAIEESELASMLTNIVNNKKAIILNPAYTLMFQSKAFMKILWDLFPNHPLLLETSYEPLQNKAQVEKKAFGREGENVTITDANGEIIDEKDGEYGNFKSIFQEYVKLNQDDEGNYYHAGVFFAYEGCGLGYRMSKKPIIDNYAKFVGHVIKE